MYVGKHFAGCIFEDILHHVDDTVVIDENGFGEFKVEDGSVSVWKATEGEVIGERNYFNQQTDLQQEEENQNTEESMLEEAAAQEDVVIVGEPIIPEPDEFGRYVEGVFRDWIEVSAYKGPGDGIEEDLFYDSRYTHLKEELELAKEEEDQEEEEALESLELDEE